MNINEFFIKYNNKFIGQLDPYPNQCVALVKQYFREVLGLPPFIGNAIDYWNNPPQGFTKIPKSLFGHPQPGDLIIWNFPPVGHIAICNWWRLFDFNVFEQNNPLGSPCHFGTHFYNNVLGWLRPDKVDTGNNVRPNLPIPSPNLPKIPLKVAFVGVNLPYNVYFTDQVALYSSGKISCVINDYLGYSHVGHIGQDEANALVAKLAIKEPFIFIFYTPNEANPYLSSYSSYDGNHAISTIPLPGDARGMAFEFAHQLTDYYNDHRGSNPPIPNPDVPSNNSAISDDLLRSKYDSFSKFYQ